MKNTLLIFLVSFVSFSSGAQLSFTITNTSATNSITCAQPSVNLVFASTVSPVSYSCFSSLVTLTGSNVNIALPGNYTVIATSGTATSTQTISVHLNTITPTSTVTPLTQSVICFQPANIVTATSSFQQNIKHYFIFPITGTTAVLSNPAFCLPAYPGTYTHIATDTLNGCSISKTFSVNLDLDLFPTLNITSPQNFTMGCGTKSIVNLFYNGFSRPASYTVSSFNGNNTSGMYTPQNGVILTGGGSHTITLKDQNFNCNIHFALSVSQNTFGPPLSVTKTTTILGCSLPSVALVGISEDPNGTPTPNASFVWYLPGSSVVPNSSIVVNSNTASPSSTLVGSYTLVVTDLSSECKSQTVIPIYQFLKPPIIFNPQSFSCPVPYLKIFASVIPSIDANIAVLWYNWQAPPGAYYTNSGTATISVHTPGTYTAIVSQEPGGCKVEAKVVVNGCVGILDSGQDIGLKVFPNPCNGLATIELNAPSEKVLIEVYNALGELILKHDVDGQKTQLDLRNQPKGIYIIRLTEHNKVIASSRLLKY